ncbi:N-acetylglucosaminyl transferase component-domain-containing protein [Lentinula raphanica]|nr:N-acetylglucosaminyl transferase component-domain-containing protein [Lentinula raphanica]
MLPSLYRPSTPVFWPLDCQISGYAFGWYNHSKRGTCIVVAGVLRPRTLTVDSDCRAQLLEILEHVQQDTDMKDLGQLQLISRCSFQDLNRKSLAIPELSDLELEQETRYSFVFYHRHQAHTLRFYCMDALNLDIDAFSDATRRTSVKSASRETSGISEDVVNQLNVAGVINAAVLERSSSMSNPSGTIRRMTKSAITTRMLNILQATLALSQSLVSHPIQVIGRLRVSQKFTVKDVSLTVQQMDVRAEQLSVLLRQTTALEPKRKGARIEAYSMKYTSFFNTLWLILNDVTIGYAFGVFLCENHKMLSEILRNFIEELLISWLQYMLCWLDSWPAGLKLNTELSRFYSGTFVDFIDIWGGILRHTIFPQLSNIIYIIGLISSFGALFGGMGGMTISIALFYDLFVIFTLHIYTCYAITMVVYERALWGLGSLWRLFRGKRFNVLRNRTDSWEYDIDQLLFGTLLFTLLAFLFPTVLAYYALFALLRLVTILCQAGLELLLAFMNHFPLFALVLKLKDPWRLPGGLYFGFVTVLVHANNKVVGTGAAEYDSARAPSGDLNEASHQARHSSEGLITTLIPVVENQPVTLKRLFLQYTRLWARLASHYNPLRLFKLLLVGRFLEPIPRHEKVNT